MKSNRLAPLVLLFVGAVHAQFWKLNSLSEKDVFVMETKARMSSGICYKEVTGNSNDPELRIQTMSYCCPGYRRAANADRMLVCEPICTEDCSDGICTTPDVCECYPGYARLGGRCEEN